jgi:hypothetical protein
MLGPCVCFSRLSSVQHLASVSGACYGICGDKFPPSFRQVFHPVPCSSWSPRCSFSLSCGSLPASPSRLCLLLRFPSFAPFPSPVSRRFFVSVRCSVSVFRSVPVSRFPSLLCPRSLLLSSLLLCFLASYVLLYLCGRTLNKRVLASHIRKFVEVAIETHCDRS